MGRVYRKNGQCRRKNGQLTGGEEEGDCCCGDDGDDGDPCVPDPDSIIVTFSGLSSSTPGCTDLVVVGNSFDTNKIIIVGGALSGEFTLPKIAPRQYLYTGPSPMKAITARDCGASTDVDVIIRIGVGFNGPATSGGIFAGGDTAVSPDLDPDPDYSDYGQIDTVFFNNTPFTADPCFRSVTVTNQQTFESIDDGSGMTIGWNGTASIRAHYDSDDAP